MGEDLVSIEVDGRTLRARKGAMLIDAADGAGVWIPRFCYHKKLSVAANCRMCLVEVERAPKPLPACATPVNEGMKVRTRSPLAVDAQKGTMEFLLINHPLDCPICEQGGECELQDLALGYGSDVSRFTEGKRAVVEKDLGPLVATGMTRCIHCTRCVRFTGEIAGLQELGAIGRGEDMEITNYLGRNLESELSGNVIDICPVGALMAKPSLFKYRPWELTQHAAVSPHDCTGTNVYIHTLRGRVIRVVPREHEEVNEVWISDRDRFSYEGLASGERARQPQVADGGGLRPVEWEDALDAAAGGLAAAAREHGPDAIGFLLAPHATLEELYLAQKLARGLGVANIDHRLRQADFSDQAAAPPFPWLGQSLPDLESVNAALLIGSNVRMDQPMVAHRLRKAALAGAALMVVNPRDHPFRFPLAARAIVDPPAMPAVLSALAGAIARHTGAALPPELQVPAAEDAPWQDAIPAMAERLLGANRGAVLLGNLATAHPGLSRLRALAAFIAGATGARLGYLPEAGNGAGAWLAGALPHRGPGGRAVAEPGLDARAMVERPRRAYVVLGLEPELDLWDPAAGLAAMERAGLVVAITGFASEALRRYAGVLLPAGAFGETAGTYVSAEGRVQSFRGAGRPPGEARPGWKVLRVLGNRLGLQGFDYTDAREVRDAALAEIGEVRGDNSLAGAGGARGAAGALGAAGPIRVGEPGIYDADPLVRRARSLQRTPLAQAPVAALHPEYAGALGLAGAGRVRVRRDAAAVELPLVLDPAVASGCVWVPAGLPQTALLGPAVGPVQVEPA